jgi:N-methylhydantoinase A
MNTTVIDAFITPGVRKYVDDLQGYFRDAGFKGQLRMVHAAGGVATPEEIKRNPVTLINSGPAAGYVGAMKFGALCGRRNIITADVGGTSFDAGVIFDGKATLRHRTMLPAPGHPSPGYLTGLSLMDVIAVGAGGGSIGWIDPRGVIRVGPQSAGSWPGPVAFGRGGQEPTLTDACLILGLLGADAFMGGSFALDVAGARAALERRLSQPTGLADAEAAAAAVYKLACIEMANNVRRVTIEKGFDPRDFSLFCYGGAGGLFLAPVCVSAAVPEMVTPENCAVFSAFGALMSDYRRSALKACAWRVGADPAMVREKVDELVETLTAEVLEAGYEPDSIIVEREADMRFMGQAAELAVPLPAGPVGDDFETRIVEAFRAAYTKVFGAESFWLNAQPEIVNLRVTLSVPNVAFKPSQLSTSGGANPQPRTLREVFWPFTMERTLWPVYRRQDLGTESRLTGPLIVESAETTVVVPPQAALAVDSLGNLVINLANLEGAARS